MPPCHVELRAVRRASRRPGGASWRSRTARGHTRAHSSGAAARTSVLYILYSMLDTIVNKLHDDDWQCHTRRSLVFTVKLHKYSKVSV